jgi:drug/metabolite transporter (DMT)-like permease
MIVATAATQLLARVPTTAHLLPKVQERAVDLEKFIMKILPIAAAFAASLVFSTTSYVFLSVSFVQMLKAMNPVIVLLISFFAGIEKPSAIYWQISGIICAGVLLTVVGESDYSTVGLTFQVFACIAEGGRLVLVNVLLRDLQLDPLSSLYYTAPVCGFTIGVLCWYLEMPVMTGADLSKVFPMVLLTNGLLAFSLNIALAYLIKHSSALTLTLSGLTKDVLLCISSVLVFGNPVTFIQVAGYAIAIGGMLAHRHYKANRSTFDQVGLMKGMAMVISRQLPVKETQQHQQSEPSPRTELFTRNVIGP